MWAKTFEKNWYGYLIAALCIGATTAALKLLGNQINSTTIALALLLVVLAVATVWGSRPAVVASLLGVVCFNFFYLPPVGQFAIDDPDNWIALFSFLVTAFTVGQLSARAKRRTKEALDGQHEIERLYGELQEAFERASHAKALEQSERLKSALLDAVTHDLRTPLTSIKASVTTLLDELRSTTNDQEAIMLDAEGRQEMLEVIDEETDRLNLFIESLMEMARIEAGEMNLRRSLESIEEIIASALERAAPLTRGHCIEVRIENDMPLARLDARAIAEVVYTLIDNAAKYSATGMTITIAAKQIDAQTIELSVEDQGQGVPVELRERVFDKFFRAMRDGDTKTSQPSGTGMGLAIAKGIVEAHAGCIRLEDGSGNQGSRVVVTLPTSDTNESLCGSSLSRVRVNEDEQ